MLQELLTHSSLCFGFVELTLFIAGKESLFRWAVGLFVLL